MRTPYSALIPGSLSLQAHKLYSTISSTSAETCQTSIGRACIK